ncbi:MAG TPA: phosphate ABC transporter permease PstA [Solirubrobacteraceae bacterium]|nr:phosphate ABC transporter permease PstA [Solirubrobacteraceae bacterium]
MTPGAELTSPEAPLFDPTAPLTATGNLRRRDGVDRAVRVGATLAAAIGVAMLALVVFSVVSKGASVISLGFFIHNPVGLVSGGIGSYLLGTIEIVAIAALVAAPIGILTGLYLTEFAGSRSRTGQTLKLALDLLQGVPTIVVGLVIYGLIVIPLHQPSGFAAGIAVAIVMLPLMARSSQEVLLLVPGTLREAADALGVSRWRTVLTVILPAASGGILTGAILAIARGAGETAPVLLADGSGFNPAVTDLNPFHAIPSIPIYILTIADEAIPNAFAHAWGAAFVLLVIILVANVVARALFVRSRGKMLAS